MLTKNYLLPILLSLITFVVKAEENSIIAFDDYDDTIYIDFVETMSEDSLWVDFVVSSFDDIASLQFTIAYEGGIRFDRLETTSIFDDNSFNPEPEFNRINFAWIDANTLSTTLNDGSIIFRLAFEIIGLEAGQIRIVNDPVEIEASNEQGDLVAVITDGLNILFEGNLITGRIFSDGNNNCIFDIDEPLLSNWLIDLENNGEHIKLKTNSEGKFSRYVEDGDYKLKIVPKNHLWFTCESEIPLSFSPEDNLNLHFDIGARPLIYCPLPEVSIVTPFLRRCVENGYILQYCNYGTIPLESAEIEVNFSDEFKYISSSVNPISQSSNSLFFLAEDLEVGQCEFIFISLELDCESTSLGETHCVSASINYQDECNDNSIWSGADIKVQAGCEGDQVKFIIKNEGNGNMNAAKSFIVIEDDVMMPQYDEDYDIDAGDSIITYYPANGSTYRLIAEQESDHPFPNTPTAAIEGCGQNEEGQYSTGFVNQFGESDGAPFEDIFCAEIIGSFDPNDKQGFPKGYGDEAYIYDDTDLEYLIRFQNTGNDTAFNVVIKDDLIENLDLNTIQVGPASHKFSWDIEDERTLVFTFNNILLPDSSVNLIGSNGFIKYKVKQVHDNGEGIKITNDADIYFDFNEPIITNETTHTIGSAFIISDIIGSGIINEDLFKIFPNPTKNGLWVEKLKTNINGNIKIYGANGRLIISNDLNDALNFIDGDSFQNGIHFYTINTQNGKTFSGKIVVIK